MALAILKPPPVLFGPVAHGFSIVFIVGELAPLPSADKEFFQRHPALRPEGPDFLSPR